MSRFTEGLAAFCERHPFVNRCVLIAENAVKRTVFDCRTCGQCILSQTAFVCCMRCPKQMRNGPCGGTRPNGHCEVYPERLCVWWQIYQRAKRLGRVQKLHKINKPADRRLQDTSAWCNMMAGRIADWSLSRKPDPDDVPPATSKE